MVKVNIFYHKDHNHTQETIVVSDVSFPTYPRHGDIVWITNRPKLEKYFKMNHSICFEVTFIEMIENVDIVNVHCKPCVF